MFTDIGDTEIDLLECGLEMLKIYKIQHANGDYTLEFINLGIFDCEWSCYADASCMEEILHTISPNIELVLYNDDLSFLKDKFVNEDNPFSSEMNEIFSDLLILKIPLLHESHESHDYNKESIEEKLREIICPMGFPEDSLDEFICCYNRCFSIEIGRASCRERV